MIMIMIMIIRFQFLHSLISIQILSLNYYILVFYLISFIYINSKNDSVLLCTYISLYLHAYIQFGFNMIKFM